MCQLFAPAPTWHSGSIVKSFMTVFIINSAICQAKQSYQVYIRCLQGQTSPRTPTYPFLNSHLPGFSNFSTFHLISLRCAGLQSQLEKSDDKAIFASLYDPSGQFCSVIFFFFSTDRMPKDSVRSQQIPTVVNCPAKTSNAGQEYNMIYSTRYIHLQLIKAERDFIPLLKCLGRSSPPSQGKRSHVSECRINFSTLTSSIPSGQAGRYI